MRQTSCGKIVKVVDGGTLDVMVMGIVQRVRLRDFKAPALGTPAGDALKTKLSHLAAGKEACLKHNNIRDQYGRLLAKVYINGKNLTKQVKALKRFLKY